MLGSSHFHRAVRAVSDRSSRTHWAWQPKFPTFDAHSLLMRLLLFVIAFLFMGIPVFASAGGPPITRYVVVGYSHAAKEGSGINPVR